MVTYRSATGRTVSVDRLQITADTGVTLAQESAKLEQMVQDGVLTKDEQVAAVEEPVESPKEPQAEITPPSVDSED